MTFFLAQAWSWNEYFTDQNATWVAEMPMTKAAVNCLRAVEEYTKGGRKQWLVSGASKRGWTTWDVGIALQGLDEKDRPITLAGLAPLVPIIPDLVEEVHWQRRAYGGLTFAFHDYMAVNISNKLDDPIFADMMNIVDVKHVRRADVPQTSRGDAAAATWIFREDESRRRRGRDVDIP